MILFEDAVYYAVDQKGKKLLEAGKEVFVMKDDLAARGFAGKAMAGFKEIDYHRGGRPDHGKVRPDHHAVR